MTAKVLWSPQAREDLLDIYLTIGLDDPSAAERFANLIEAQAALLADHPRLGPRRPEILPTTRVLIERPYLILYETHPMTRMYKISSYKQTGDCYWTIPLHSSRTVRSHLALHLHNIGI